MPSVRSMAGELARLLAAVSVPVFVLDGESRLVYCNPACANWIESAAEDLVGQVCAYHSSPVVDRAARKLAGLCPPPEAFSGERALGMIYCQRDDGTLARRRAEFIPLLENAGDPCGVLAVVDPADRAAEADRGGARNEAVALHDRLQQLHRELRRHFAMDRLLGDSAVMARVRSQVRLAAASEATVLVVGQPGSGRQHVARAIHDDRPAEQIGTYLPLSCEALGAELLRSTLAALLGRRQSDDKPTASLLLNDVHELPPEVQAELAATLGNRPPSLRIISTSIPPLDELAAAGHFRADLAHALSTVVIHLPALAERPADIPLLRKCFSKS